MKECEHCCGDCCWFKYESTDGWGMCMKANELELQWDKKHCSGVSCKMYISVAEMRHHLATLMLHNRWRRSIEPTGFYKMQDPKEIGLAIDFAIKYIKTFMEL